ncbi:superoxide dismutase [Cohnella hongkongensis]|uniref:superoxide dismutase n=1 Tax=Cohnella hongkongensis TaxID=178337 RepID=A0ABV9F990_9BACL
MPQTAYGPIDPLRLSEEIAAWKARERENTSAIRSAMPELEPVYTHWLADWERVFEQTREYALRLKQQYAERNQEGSVLQDELGSGLLEEALKQSREFGRQLQLLRQQSEAVRNAQPSHAVFAYVERQPSFGEEAVNRLRASGVPEPSEPQRPAEPDARSETAAPSSPGTAETAAGGPVPIGRHTLPPLPYAYNALEPYIDEKTMRIHHDKHHLSYVEGLNTAEKKLAEARRTGNFELVKHWERELAFNGAGHYLHTLFWNTMAPRGGGKPTGALLEEIHRSFGSYDAFKKQFSEAAAKVEGGGWAILVWSPRSHRLEILTAEKHQNLSQWDVIPLLPLDVWEHAYYLKHQNDRAAYVKDWWNVVHWPYVAERFAKARTVKWTPY